MNREVADGTRNEEEGRLRDEGSRRAKTKLTTITYLFADVRKRTSKERRGDETGVLDWEAKEVKG